MKNKKMASNSSNVKVVTDGSSAANPELACKICGLIAKTTTNFLIHLHKDHSKIELTYYILKLSNLPNEGVKHNILTEQNGQFNSLLFDENCQNLDEKVTPVKILHQDEISNLENVDAPNSSLSNLGKSRSLPRQLHLQLENSCQLKDDSSDGGQVELKEALKCSEKTRETSSINFNQADILNEEEIQFLNQLGLVKCSVPSDLNLSPNQVPINTNASADVESPRKLLYDQIESFNFRLPLKFFAENPVPEEESGFESWMSELLKIAPQNEISNTSNSNLVLTTKSDLSTEQPESLIPAGTCVSSLGNLESKTSKTPPICLNNLSKLVPLEPKEVHGNQPNGISGTSAAIDISNQPENITKSQASIHQNQLSSPKNIKLKPNNSVDSYSSLVLLSSSKPIEENIRVSDFSAKENVNLGDPFVCENNKSLVQKVKLAKENVPKLIKMSEFPQGGKLLKIGVVNKFVERSTNGEKEGNQSYEAINSNEIVLASDTIGNSRNFCRDIQICTITDFISKPDILTEKEGASEVSGTKINVESCKFNPKTPGAPFLVNSNGIWKVAKPIQIVNLGTAPNVTPVDVGNSIDLPKTLNAKEVKKIKKQSPRKRSKKLETLSDKPQQNSSAKRKRKPKIDEKTNKIRNETKSVPNLLPLSNPAAEISQAGSSSNSLLLDHSYYGNYYDRECSRESSNSLNLNISSTGATLNFPSWNSSNGSSHDSNSQTKSDCVQSTTICQQQMMVEEIYGYANSNNGELLKGFVPSNHEKGARFLKTDIWSQFQKVENESVPKKQPRPYCCDICGKSYSRKNHLIRHCRMHLNQRPYECDICHKSFTTNSILKQHQRLHSGERPFVCSVCDKSFTQKSSLLTHSMLHNGKTFKCYFCRFAVVSNHKLQRHLKRHHISDSKLYCCVCEYRFGLEGTFREHLAEVHNYSSDNNVELYPDTKKRRRVLKKYGCVPVLE